MARLEYSEYIKSTEWICRSRLYRNTHPCCEVCGETGKSKLQTHHLSYERLGNEPDEDLMSLCRICHTAVEWVKDNAGTGNVLPVIYREKISKNPDVFKKALGVYASFLEMFGEFKETPELPAPTATETDRQETRPESIEKKNYLEKSSFSDESELSVEKNAADSSIEFVLLPYPFIFICANYCLRQVRILIELMASVSKKAKEMFRSNFEDKILFNPTFRLQTFFNYFSCFFGGIIPVSG